MIEVSVLIPYYNDESYLRESIQSVLDQTFKNFELILIDHASTDSSSAIAHSFNDTRIIHTRLEKNMEAGGGLIFRKFLSLASGKYYKLFCADDVMLPDGLDILVKYMKEHPDIDVAFGNMAYIDEHSREISGQNHYDERADFDIRNTEEDLIKMYYLGVSSLPFPASIIKQEAARAATIDDVSILMFDMTLWASMLMQGYKFAFLDEYIVQYRIHSEQMCSNEKGKQLVFIACAERLYYNNLFLNIKETKMIKLICHDSPYFDQIDKVDEDMYPFIICHYFLTTSHVTADIVFAISKMFEMLNSSVLREKIERCFSYTVGDFRKFYTNQHLYPMINEKELIAPKSLSFTRLLSLLGKKIFHTIYPYQRLKAKRKKTH